MPRTTKTTKTTKAKAAAKKRKAPAKAAKAPKKALAKKAAPKKAAPKKAVAKKAAPKKAVAKKAAPKKAAPKKAVAKKAAPKKAAPKKVVAEKAAPRKAAKAIRTAKAPRMIRRTSNPEFQNFEPYKPARGEKYMNEPQREHFKSILLDWKSELMQEVDRTVSHMKDEAANFPDPADRATQEEEFSLELRTRDRERKLIKKIDSTMELIDQDDYGYCEACGIDIGIQRLEARPTANQCIDCKTLAEIKEKQEMG